MDSPPTELSCELLPAKPSKLWGKFDHVAVLHQRVAKVEASPHWQKPRNGAACVRAGGTKAVGSLASCDLRVDGASIRGKLLLAML